MRPDFDPTFNGAWDKLDRYHREAVVDTALRQRTHPREPVLSPWWHTWTQWARQVLHLRPSHLG